MNENDRSFTYSHEEAKAMTLKAVRMAGRSLNISHKPVHFSWSSMAEDLIADWERNPMHYQMVVQMEDNVIQFAINELLEWVEIQSMVGG